jgi:FKBP-type peptidyl-prolyl cis-trans isomerase
MKSLFALTLSLVFGAATMAEDKKLEMPDLKSKEWKEVKDGGGLKIWDVKEGKGDAVKAGAKVKVHYTGWNLDGKIFDSSVQRGEPIEFGLNQVIKGWTNGVPGMKPGGVRRLYIPSALAYGERGAGRAIPPNADLVFEIELLESK